jgi:iron complex transport system substrate-binding protein
MLVELVPHARIRAISHYSQDPATSSIPLPLARSFPAIHGTAEEVLALHPELVVSSSFTPAATREALARAGLKVLYLDSPRTIAASRDQVRQLAAVVGAEAEGAAMIARMDAATVPAPPSPAIPALLWIGGSMASGDGTLLHEMMVRGGFRDAAADYGLSSTGTISMEQIIAAPPRVMLVPDLAGEGGDGRAARLRAEAIRASRRPVLQAAFPRQLVNCGGPIIIKALTRLRAVRAQVTS